MYYGADEIKKRVMGSS